MIALACFIWSILTALFKSKGRLEAENAALRHQMVVLQRKIRGRVDFINGDRLFFVLLYRCFPSILKEMVIVPACDCRTLASGPFPLLLAMEITTAGRAAAN